MTKKTILIAGGAGFIGSHLCQRLLRENRIICLDNFISGSQKNVQELEGHKNFKFTRHDITKPLKISQKIDEIYNLACPASPVDYMDYPIETLLTSSIGVKNLLDLAVKNKSSLLHTSTSEVYGDPKEHPQKETYNRWQKTPHF